MSRLLVVLGGLVWLGVLVSIASAIRWSEPAPRPVPRESTLPPLLTRLNAARPEAGATPWIVFRATSTHNVLVVNVRAVETTDAVEIADRQVGAMTDRAYDEVLIYVWAAGDSGPYPDRRVQWTPARGYAELVIGN
jgi:hypothetical protein